MRIPPSKLNFYKPNLSFNKAPGKDAEVVYARGRTVQPGATLLTNGIKVVTRNALIQGTVADMAIVLNGWTG